MWSNIYFQVTYVLRDILVQAAYLRQATELSMLDPKASDTMGCVASVAALSSVRPEFTCG